MPDDSIWEAAPPPIPNHNADWIADVLTSWIAAGNAGLDFVVRQGESEIIYVDVEGSKFLLITVKEGRVADA